MREHVIPLLLNFAIKGQVDAMFMIDASGHSTEDVRLFLFSSAPFVRIIGSFPHCVQSIIAHIAKTMETAEQYDKTVITFNLESLVSVHRDYSSLHSDEQASMSSMQATSSSSSNSMIGGPTFSLRVLRPAVLSHIMGIMQSHERARSSGSRGGVQHWFIGYVGESKYLSQLWREQLHWPVSIHQRDVMNESVKKNQQDSQEHVCKHCRLRYMEGNNGPSECRGRHLLTQDGPAPCLFKVERDPATGNETRTPTLYSVACNALLNPPISANSQPLNFQWMCCSAVLYTSRYCIASLYLSDAYVRTPLSPDSLYFQTEKFLGLMNQ